VLTFIIYLKEGGKKLEEKIKYNYLSRLKAILGKYPKSSNNVNRGKNIAIGGSITEIIQATVL
jgi:hypothetical protein